MDAVPQVITSATPLPSQPGWKKKLPFLGIGFLVIVILVELIWGFKLLSSAPISSADSSPPIIDNVIPQLILIPDKQQVKVGEMVPVTIKVVTAGNPTDSVDVLIKYDPAILEASQSNFFDLGVIYPEFPVAEFDNKQGLIQISGTSPLNHSGFSGIGTLAKLNFKAKSEGKTAVSVVFEKNSTADSNLVLSGTNQDLLEQVSDSSIAVTKNPVSEIPNPTSSCTGFFQYCRLGDKTGKQFCQSGVVKENVCTFDIIQTVSCSECQLQ